MILNVSWIAITYRLSFAHFSFATPIFNLLYGMPLTASTGFPFFCRSFTEPVGTFNYLVIICQLNVQTDARLCERG